MRFFIYLFTILTILSSCKEEEQSAPDLPKKYGSGMYITTDNGISFVKNGEVENQIFKAVNNIAVSNINRIKFQGTKAFIASDNNLYSVNVKTFGLKDEVSGFNHLIDFDFVSMERVFAVDKGDSKVKVIDLDRMEVISDIETGDNTKPVFIATKWYRSIIMNGGGVADSLKDSTIVAIDYRDELVPLADMAGSLFIGENPNSAININDLRILCQGIYDPNDLTTQTQSTLTHINPWNMQLLSSKTLNGIYNAKNLVSNYSGSNFFFTASDGVYTVSPEGTGVSQITSVISDVLFLKPEQYQITDSTSTTSNMLYINDAANNPNVVYKYDLVLGSFTDTIIVDGNVRDINFY